MSIDEAIGLLERGSQYNYYDSAEDFCKAYDMAIATMRKYKKIQEILSSASYIENDTVYSYTYDEDSRVKHIRQVVEDGNDG